MLTTQFGQFKISPTFWHFGNSNLNFPHFWHSRSIFNFPHFFNILKKNAGKFKFLEFWSEYHNFLHILCFTVLKTYRSLDPKFSGRNRDKNDTLRRGRFDRGWPRFFPLIFLSNNTSFLFTVIHFFSKTSWHSGITI